MEKATHSRTRPPTIPPSNGGTPWRLGERYFLPIALRAAVSHERTDRAERSDYYPAHGNNYALTLGHRRQAKGCKIYKKAHSC